jgi:hypothetical protein
MATTEHHPEVAHERSDVNVRGILWFAAGLVIVAAVIHVAVLGLFVLLERRTAADDPKPLPLSIPAGQLPPRPRLQTRPVNDLKSMRAEEDILLHSSDEGGRIPIERAKQLIVEKHLLPTRPRQAP